MTPDEIDQAASRGLIADLEGISLSTATTEEGFLVVGGLCAIPIGTISTVLDPSSDIEIVDPAQAALATLCFTRARGNASPVSLTKYQYVAFLADADLAEVEEPRYNFKRDYVVVEQGRLKEYINHYKSSSIIWGMFSHDVISSMEQPRVVEKVVALPDLCTPTTHHGEVFGRYIMATNPLERYLRLYQSMELLFDYVIFKRVQLLGNNLEGFSRLMSEHGRTELDRLKAIVREFCSNPSNMAKMIELSASFPAVRDDIFHIYTKSGDPVADPDKWNKLKQIIDDGSLTETELRQQRLITNQASFQQFIADLAAYWIYRVRSSIAHNRVGEFLLQDCHADFITDFAEPLLTEAVKQVFANPDFSALVR